MPPAVLRSAKLKVYVLRSRSDLLSRSSAATESFSAVGAINITVLALAEVVDRSRNECLYPDCAQLLLSSLHTIRSFFVGVAGGSAGIRAALDSWLVLAALMK